MILISYNALNLHASPYSVTGYDGYGMPEVEIKSIELARHDGAIQTAQRVGSRTITVEGQIKTLTKPELIAAIDNLKAYLYQTRGSLVVTDEDGITRTFEATPRNVSIVRARGGATQATYSISFYCPKPYSTSQNVTLASVNNTAQSTNVPFSVGGTYPAEPVVTLTINSITAGLQTITVGNQAANRSISITRSFVAGDSIVIDHAKKSVYVNTTKVDYEGAFTKWDVGGGSMSYVDTAGTRNVDIVIKADVRML